MDLSQLEIRLSRHAFMRANERDIDLAEINKCIKTGKTVKTGKNLLKFIKKYDNYRIICLCEIRTDCVWVITVMRD